MPFPGSRPSPPRRDVTALLPHTVPVDGVQRGVFDFTVGLGDLGVTTRLLTLHHGSTAPAWRAHAEVLHSAPWLAWSPRTPRTLPRIAAAAAALPPTPVVVAHTPQMLNAGGVIAWRPSTRLVFHAHNAPPPWLRWGDRLRVPGTRAVARTIVASTFMHDVWRAMLPAAMPLDLVPYAIDTDHFALIADAERRAARARMGLEPDTLILGYVGRLEATKGVDVLARAAARLAGTRRRVHLLIQGAPNLGVPQEEAAAFRRECDAALGGATVTWRPPGDVRETLAAAHVAVVPSVWQEPSGLTVSEALSTGTPLVASDVGGIPEQMPALPGAQVVPGGSSSALAAAVERVAASVVDRAALREHVVRHRARPRVAARYARALGLDVAQD